MNKKKVYVETSVISNLTARPSHNLIDAAIHARTSAPRRKWKEEMKMAESSDIMEELWRVKAEFASQYASLREFFDALIARQNAAHPEFAAT